MAACGERYFRDGDSVETKAFINKLMQLTLDQGSEENPLNHTRDGYEFQISEGEFEQHRAALHNRLFNCYVLKFRRRKSTRVPVARFIVQE